MCLAQDYTETEILWYNNIIVKSSGLVYIVTMIVHGRMSTCTLMTIWGDIFAETKVPDGHSHFSHMSLPCFHCHVRLVTCTHMHDSRAH